MEKNMEDIMEATIWGVGSSVKALGLMSRTCQGSEFGAGFKA